MKKQPLKSLFLKKIFRQKIYAENYKVASIKTNYFL